MPVKSGNLLGSDLVLLDPDRSFTVRAADSPAAQGYTPFEGLGGQLVYDRGAAVGPPRGRSLRRPTPAP